MGLIINHSKSSAVDYNTVLQSEHSTTKNVRGEETGRAREVSSPREPRAGECGESQPGSQGTHR